MEAPRHITEKEFMDHRDARILELARAIARSGKNISEIAHACRLKWDTVYAASQCRPVRFDNYCRIQYYLTINNEKTKNNPCAE